MKSHDEISGYPFYLIAGKGLGHAKPQKGMPFAQRQFGQANLKYSVNVATGNLVAQDRLISVADKGEPVELSYLYNSLESAWRLTVGRKIKHEKIAAPTSLFGRAIS